ncbi:hypothetical protein Trydic_g13667 [Trypoxylus dichotomus]
MNSPWKRSKGNGNETYGLELDALDLDSDQTIQSLQEKYRELIIDQSIIVFPSFHLWDYVNSSVYTNKLATLYDNKANIERVIANIGPNLCGKVTKDCV